METLPTDQAGVAELWESFRWSPREKWLPEHLAWACCFTFAGRLGGRAHAKSRSQQSWGAYKRRLMWVSKNLKGVRLTNLDWREAVVLAPDDWVIYADPPYAGTSNGSYATGGINNEALLNVLRSRKAMLTEYQCPDGWEATDYVHVHYQHIHRGQHHGLYRSPRWAGMKRRKEV